MCENITGKASQLRKKEIKKIKYKTCDPSTGLAEYFVYVEGRKKGSWLSEKNIDLASLTLHQSSSIKENISKIRLKIVAKEEKEKDIIILEKEKQHRLQKEEQLRLRKAKEMKLQKEERLRLQIEEKQVRIRKVVKMRFLKEEYSRLQTEEKN